jgi:hypothetical protein
MYPILLVMVSGLTAAEPPAPAPKMPLGKDTTFFTEPLDKEGYVDYEAALNKELS